LLPPLTDFHLKLELVVTHQLASLAQVHFLVDFVTVVLLGILELANLTWNSLLLDFSGCWVGMVALCF